MSLREQLASLRAKKKSLDRMLSEKPQPEEKNTNQKKRSCSQPATPAASEISEPAEAQCPHQKVCRKHLKKACSTSIKMPTCGQASTASTSPDGESFGGTAGSARPPKEDTLKAFALTSAEKLTISSALKQGSLPQNLRRRCFNAINRQVKAEEEGRRPPSVGKSMADRWERACCKPNGKGKFQFLQDWAQEASGAQMTVFQDHDASTWDNQCTEFCWMTKMEFYASKNALQHPEMMAYCDKVLGKARTRKHQQQQYQDDEQMKQYRILFDESESVGEDRRRRSRLSIQAAVEDEAKTATVKMLAYEQTSCRNHHAWNEVRKDRPRPQKTKLDIEDMRTKKLSADVQKAQNIREELKESKLPYCQDMLDELENKSKALLELGSSMQQAKLKSEQEGPERLWWDAVALMRALRIDIDAAEANIACAQNRTFKSYVTDYDLSLEKPTSNASEA